MRLIVVVRPRLLSAARAQPREGHALQRPLDVEGGIVEGGKVGLPLHDVPGDGQGAGGPSRASGRG